MTEPSGLSFSLDPRQMGEVGVDGCCNDFGVDFSKFLDPVGEGQNSKKCKLKKEIFFLDKSGGGR